MPQVPFLPRQATDAKDSLSASTQEPAYVDKNLRQQFEQSVKQEIKQNGGVSVSFLDQFAGSHFNEKMTDAPAVLDYAALRRTAEQEERQLLQRQQQQQVLHDAAWTVKLGALLPDNASLQAYLDAQLPNQQKQWEESGLSAQEAAGQTRRLRAQTIEKHILRSLSADDWQTAQQVLSAQGKCLDDSVGARCAQQVRHTFAKQQAKQLWQSALLQSDNKPQKAQEIVNEQLQEPDEELKQDIQREIAKLSAQTHRQQSLACADLFAQLAQVPYEQESQLLAGQNLLEGEALEVACQAAQQPSQPATTEQQAWFVKNYFNTDADLERAYHKGLCSSKDYFRLKTVQHKSAGGQEPQTQHWLCRSIETWMHKQGFSSQDIMQASYSVLKGTTDEEQINLWKQLKTLLTY